MKTSSQDFEERRAWPRLQTRDSSAVMLMPDSIISFCVLDISKSGLAFCYNGRSLESNLRDKAYVAFFGENIGAADIPVRIISDTEVDKENIWLVADEGRDEVPYLRRCGVEFSELSEDQEAAIRNYIHYIGSN